MNESNSLDSSQEKLLDEVKGVLNAKLPPETIKLEHLQAFMTFHVKQMQSVEVAILKTQGQLDAYRDLYQNLLNELKATKIQPNH